MLTFTLTLIVLAILALLYAYEFRKSTPSPAFLNMLVLMALVCLLIVAHENGLNESTLSQFWVK